MGARAGLSRRQFGYVAAGALAGISSSRSFAAGPTRRIAYANLSDENSFSALVLSGFKTEAARRPGLEMGYFDNKGDAAKAVENARIIATSKFDLLIEYSGNPGANVQIGRIMKDAGIPSIAITTPIEGAPLFAVDNVEAGRISGRRLAEAAKAKWPDATPVVVISGFPEFGATIAERGDWAKKGIQEVYPDIKFEEFSNKNDSGLTRQVATDMLTRFPNRKIIFWATVDAIALACVAAIRNANREADAFVSTTGGDRASFPEIRRAGTPYVGTYAFFPELWAQDLLDAAEKILRKEPVPARIVPKNQAFLDAQNIDQYYPR